MGQRLRIGCVPVNKLRNEIQEVARKFDLIDEDGFVFINTSFLSVPTKANAVYSGDKRKFDVTTKKLIKK